MARELFAYHACEPVRAASRSAAAREPKPWKLLAAVHSAPSISCVDLQKLTRYLVLLHMSVYVFTGWPGPDMAACHHSAFSVFSVEDRMRTGTDNLGRRAQRASGFGALCRGQGLGHHVGVRVWGTMSGSGFGAP